MSTSKKAFAAIRWTAAGTISRACIGFAQLAILARLLEPADFGLMALALAVVNTAMIFADMGVSNALIHYREITREELSSLYWLNVGTGGLLSVLIALAAPALAAFYRQPPVEGVLLGLSVLFLVVAIGQQLRVVAEKNLDFRSVALVEVAASTVGFLVAVGSALAGARVYSIVAGTLAQAGTTTALLWIFLSRGWRPRLHFAFADLPKFLRYGFDLIGISAANALALQGDVILAGRLFNSALVGLYAQPRELCMRIMFIVNPIITRVGLPVMAEIQKERGRVARVYVKTLRMTASINFPIYAALALFAPEVVRLVLGEKWLDSADLLRAVAIWCLVRSVGNPIGSLLFALGETKRALASSVLVLVGVLVSAAIGARFGLIGVPIALAVLYTLLVVPFWYFLVRPVCGVSFYAYHSQLGVPLLATILATVMAWGAAYPIDGSVMRLAVGFLAGGLSYVAVSFVLNREWIDAMRELALPLTGRLGPGR